MKTTNNPSTSQVGSPFVEGIRVGSRSTLDDIYAGFFPKVQQFILKHSGTVDDAKDIFQDALLVIYNSAKDKDFKLTCKFGTYLYSICRNIWFKQIRDRKIKISKTFEENTIIDKDELEESIIWLERYKIYKRQFNNISEKCQALLKLYLEGTDMKTIAEKFGFANVAYARKRKFKCKEQLILKIEQDLDYKKIDA
ncbi:MAG: RNA polymerase sigma factor [Saprospiraceae bacterium]